MKRIVFTLSLLLMMLLVSPLLASTNVGATISADTQWDASGSPYIIQARVLVPPGVTLKVGPGVQIVSQGPATLQIGGDLRIEGSAAAPAVVNMTDGGLQSALFIDGGEAHLSNMKVIGGVFLAQDATIRMDASEVTKGSGLYLKGSTVAHLKNNKFYGNATGVVLDGPIEADMQFNTLVQNTYGLYLKDYAKLVFVNNSVHDNESEVVNNATKAKLGGNYWGTMSPKSVKDKIKGDTSVTPMKDLKDILRAYLRSELPVITKGMSDQAEAEDRRADLAAKAALKAFKYKQSQADVLAMEAKMKTQTPNATPTPTTPAPAAAAAPIASPTMAPMMDINLPTAVPTAVPTAIPTAFPVMSAPVQAAPAAPAVSSVPEPPSITNGLPAPPMVSPNAPEPPALGDLAGSVPPPPSNISSVPPSGSPIPSLPTSMPTASSSTNAPSTPTPGLGSGSVSSDDLASIVATAQAASTSTNSTVAPPMPPDMTTLGSPADASPVNTSTPTVMATSTYTSVPNADTSTFTATPTITFTMVMTDTPTYTSTPMPSIPTSTPTAPTVSFVPTVAAPASSAPAAAPAASSASLVPPPPDFGDSPMQGVQPPMVNASDANNVPAAAPAAPPASAPAASAPAVSAPAPMSAAPSAPSAPAAATPSSSNKPPDLDVDGMQAPPMDSGLDYANPKK